MKTKKLLTLTVIAIMAFSLSACSDQCVREGELTEVFDRVFDAGTYTSLDADYAQQYFADTYDQWDKDGGCTAVAKVNDDGEMLVGRNMDLTICNKAAYVFRTKVDDCYETINTCYSFRDISPNYDFVKKNGLGEQFEKVMPFMSDDVMNSEGLYCEINMREGEVWPTGETKFGCAGTNPDADERIYLFSLPMYIGMNCATVDEAVEYVKTLDIYSMYGNEMDANTYCFILADKSGHYGLLEFGKDQIYWNEGQQAQANFFINEELAQDQLLKAGVGRYDKVMSGIDKVQTENDMFKLMDSVSYYQTYFPDKCQFDNRSEFIGLLPYWTTDAMMKPEYKEDIESVVAQTGRYLDSLSRQEIRDLNYFWESIFTEVANCNNRTIDIRFYEDDSKRLTLSF